MPYNSITDRTDAEALIPEEVSAEFLSYIGKQSAALQLFKRIPVSGKKVRFPVLSALPVAYWVDGDTGLKQTTDMAWTNKYMTIEEVAVILPIPEAVVDDMRDAGNVDVWSQVQGPITEAFGIAIDSALFFGTNAPASFPDDVHTATLAAGNVATEGTAAAAGGYFADLDKAIELVETDGFDPTGIVAARSLKGKLRAARASDGQKLDAGRISGSISEVDGMPISYVLPGLWPAGVAGGADATRALVGDWSQFVVGVRQDISFKLLDQAVIQDGTGAIVYNLAQQDMVAMRFVMRLGWQVANLINRDQLVEANRYPVAALQYNV